jgi:hypothetical protein
MEDQGQDMKLVCFGLLLVICQPAEESIPSRVTVAICPVRQPGAPIIRSVSPPSCVLCRKAVRSKAQSPKRSACAIRRGHAQKSIAEKIGFVPAERV